MKAASYKLPLDNILAYEGRPPQVLPANTEVADRSIFEAYLNDPIPRMQIKPMHAFRVKSDGILLRNGCILKEGSPYYFQQDHPVNKQYYLPNVRKRLFRRLIRYYFLDPVFNMPKPCVWLTDQYSQFYFHWVVETLPRIYLWSLLDQENRPVILPKKLLRYSYVKNSLEFFPKCNFLFLDDGRQYRFTNAMYVSPMGKPYQFNAPLLQAFNTYIRSVFTSSHGGGVIPQKKIYINRGKANKRKASNAAAVDAIFHEQGYEIVHLEELSLLDQLKLASNSKIIAGIHGAGLANVVFAHPNTKVLELQQNLGWPSVYYRLANALGNPYYYSFCTVAQGNETGDINADINIDLTELKQVLQLVLQQTVGN